MSDKKFNSFNELWDVVEDSEEYSASEAILDFTIELENLLKKRGLSRADLAAKIGKSQPYITKVFRGDSNFTIKTMAQLVKAVSGKLSLHVTPEEEGRVDWLRKIEGGKKHDLSHRRGNEANAWFKKIEDDIEDQEVAHIANGGLYEYPAAS